jgi:hypothetical protein
VVGIIMVTAMAAVVLLLRLLDGDRRERPQTEPRSEAVSAGGSQSPCDLGSPQPGDVDGDGTVDLVTVEAKGEWEWLVRLRRANGGVDEAIVRSPCATLLGTADVNGDGRDEIWFKDDVGNTAHTFNLLAWAGERLRVVVDPGVHNPLVIGWGFSGGATLWCADGTGDGRTDIIQQSFTRNAEGGIEDEGEVIYELRDDSLREVVRGRPRPPLPGTSSALVCGSVSW